MLHFSALQIERRFSVVPFPTFIDLLYARYVPGVSLYLVPESVSIPHWIILCRSLFSKPEDASLLIRGEFHCNCGVWQASKTGIELLLQVSNIFICAIILHLLHLTKYRRLKEMFWSPFLKIWIYICVKFITRFHEVHASGSKPDFKDSLVHTIVWEFKKYKVISSIIYFWSVRTLHIKVRHEPSLRYTVWSFY